MSLKFFSQFFYSQFFVTPKYPTEDFSEKIVIITGANTGLGFEAAKHVARLNCAKLILAVRTASKGQKAKEDIQATTKRADEFIEVWDLDLSKADSVKAFAQRAQQLPRLDVLVENAGISTTKYELSPDGNETTIQTNVISTLLLLILLLPKIRETGHKHNTPTHLAVVTSELHHAAAFKQRHSADIYEELKSSNAFDSFQTYPTSKLMEILFVRELVKHTAQPPPVITTVNPGFCKSDLTRHFDGFLSVVTRTFQMFVARSTEVGARTLVAGMTCGNEAHGKYMADGVLQEPVAWVETPEGVEVQKRVYEQTLALMEKLSPGVTSNI